ncbi:uncharacterized protein ColSpa_02018 [Colletotrichum spaethianum]|uniref:Uncharacterized protein n=1 Tax=Colletotrichum spaethianum TaxID=700344 RepID=A0AA37L4R4_9PEZI|nr:uncharacterized protein ColSpa_02018 [Colletotrichum spaethianum]GKT41837.1 hypothetical protein ColSpa_02018 [Colletotrichum spaethianum]
MDSFGVEEFLSGRTEQWESSSTFAFTLTFTLTLTLLSYTWTSSSPVQDARRAGQWQIPWRK